MTRTARTAAALAVTLAAALPARALAQQGDSAAAIILSPEPGERVAADQVLVAVTLPKGAAGADSVAVHVGPRDVTAQAEVKDGVLTWRPAEPLPPGPYRVVVSPRGAEPTAWTFNVAPAAHVATSAGASAAPVQARSAAIPHGTVVMEGGGNAISGPGADFSRERDFLPQMWLTAGGDLGRGWRYTARAYLSGYESSFRQPVDRFRADLRSGWASLALGDVNPVLNEMILSGRRVRGGQADLRAGPLRLDLVAGRANRAIPGALDPLDPTLVLRGGTYGQDLVAVRPSVGIGDRFRVGLTVMNVRDAMGSIPILRTSPDPLDSATLAVNPSARDNLVAGLDVNLQLLGGRLTARYENAASLLNRDISDRPQTRAALDSAIVAAGGRAIGVDPKSWDWLFILNSSIVPLDPRNLTNTAHQLRATLRQGAHTITGEWRSVGVDYNTLGSPGLQRDFRGWRIRDSFSLPGDALFVTAGYEQDRDNLDGSGFATTTGRDAFATLTWQAPREMVFTGSFRIGSRGNGLDSTQPGALDQATRSLSAGALVPVSIVSTLRTKVSLNASWVSRRDPTNPAGDTRDLYYLAGLQGETEDRVTSFSLLAGQDRADFPGLADGRTTFDRLLASGRRQIDPRWAARFDGSLLAARSPASASAPGPRYTRAEALGGGEWQWRRDTALDLTAGVVSYADKRTPGLNTTQLVARLRVSQAF